MDRYRSDAIAWLKLRSLTDEQERRAWRRFFFAGHDFLNELGPLGLNMRHGMNPAEEPIVREAWHRFGADFLATCPAAWAKDPWALRQFGEPNSMPVKRRQPKQLQHRITPEAVAAFRAGDWMDLHHALDLKPWEASPIDATTAAPPPYPHHGWEQARELRLQLIAAAKSKAKPEPKTK